MPALCRKYSFITGTLLQRLLCDFDKNNKNTMKRAAYKAAAAYLLIVIWLILPVVICLSQRLSHACLSISTYTVKLRMAH